MTVKSAAVSARPADSSAMTIEAYAPPL